MRALSIEPQDLQRRLLEGDDLVLLDIRKEEERISRSLENSIWIPEIELPLLVDYLHNLGPLVVACSYGERGGPIAEWLGSLGLNVRFLEGGVARLRAFLGESPSSC